MTCNLDTYNVLVPLFIDAGFSDQTAKHLAEQAIRSATIEKNRRSTDETIQDIAIKLATRGISLAPRLRAKAASALSAESSDVVEQLVAEAADTPSPTTGERLSDIRKE